MGNQPAKVAFDVERYARRVRKGPCFVCAFIAGDPDYRHHLVYENDETVAFLARYPTLPLRSSQQSEHSCVYLALK
jgi:histidine triad (HIT) family protein/ATP adenylyltransferase